MTLVCLGSLLIMAVALCIIAWLIPNRDDWTMPDGRKEHW